MNEWKIDDKNFVIIEIANFNLHFVWVDKRVSEAYDYPRHEAAYTQNPAEPRLYFTFK